MGPYLSDSSLRLNTVSLPRLVRTFRQQYPGVTLQLRESMTDTQIEELKRGALDVGLLYGTVDGPGFSCQVIWSEPLVTAIPRKQCGLVER